MKQNELYTTEQIQFLRDNYPKLTQPELAKAFNDEFDQSRTKKAIAETCKRKGIKSGRNGRFEKGNKPWTTGTKGLVKSNSGNFKKGPRPELRAEIGHERIDKNGYIWKKVEQPNKFRLKHQLVWEEHKGEIPKGMVLWFIDGNRQNCIIENLELVSRQEQVRRNKLRMSQVPEELQETIKLVAKIQMATGIKRKEVRHV